MKTKCYKCEYLNEKDAYQCEKCWEIFRQSKEKYDQYIKRGIEEKEELEKQWLERTKNESNNTKNEQEEKEEKTSYRFTYLISVIPLLFRSIRSALNNGTTSDIILGSILTIIMLILRTKVINFIEEITIRNYFNLYRKFIFAQILFVFKYSFLNIHQKFNKKTVKLNN